MPIKTQEQLLTDVAAYITSEGSGAISGADVRERLVDIIDSIYQAVSESASVDLDELTDVVVVSPANGQYLKYDGTNWVNEALHGNLLGVSSIASQGFVVWSALGTFLQRSIAGTAGRVAVTNGNGVGGNPTIDLLPSGVTPGTFQNVTVDTYGRVTGGTNGTYTTANIDAHIAAVNNPHATTALQVGALVSLDGVSNAGGNIDLVPGAGITITPNDTTNTITIAVSYAQITTLDSLTDVVITSPASGQTLTYNGTNWVNSAAGGGGSTNLDGLSDVTIVTPTTAQVLRYNGTTWVNVQLSHSDLSGVGTNTHAQIDTHLANTTNPHSTTATQVGALVSVDGVSNPGGNIDLIGSGITITADDAANTITFTVTPAATNLDGLTDVVIASPATAQVLRYNGTGWVNAQLAHADLSGVGTNTHAQIDAHIASTANPHNVTAAQVGALTSLEGISGPGNINLIEGAGTTIVTDVATRTITITCTASGGGGGGVTDLEGLSDVDLTTPTEGQTLIYRSGQWVNETPTGGGGGGATDLEGLSDVDLTTPTEGQVIVYRSGQWVNETLAGGGGATALDNLTDVTVSGTPGDTQTLSYDAVSGQWKPKYADALWLPGMAAGVRAAQQIAVYKSFINFKQTGAHIIYTVPAGRILVLETPCDFIATLVTTSGTAPQIKIGTVASTAAILGTTILSNANFTNTRQSISIGPVMLLPGEAVRLEVTVASTAAVHQGTFSIRGFLIDTVSTDFDSSFSADFTN